MDVAKAEVSCAREPGAEELVSRLERIPTSRWHIRTRVIVGIATFFDAFDILAIAFVLPALIREWHLTTAQAGILISAGFAGQFAGAFVLGGLAERIGRIPTITISVALFSVASLFCAATNSVAVLIVLRAIQGIGLGGEVPVAATYINELTKSHHRGRFILLYEVIFPVGLVFAGFVGSWVVPTLGWRYMFLIGGLPAVLAVYLTRLIPESPRWLIAQGELGRAADVIGMIERAAAKTAGAGVSVAVEQASGKVIGLTHVATTRSRFRELLSPFYRGRTIVIWLLWFCSAFVVYGLVSWLPTIYSSVYDVSIKDALRFGLFTNMAGLAGTIACALLIDVVGRRRWFTFAFACGAVVLAILTTQLADVHKVVLLASVGYFFVNTTALALYVYTPECYPTRFRAFGTSIGTAWQRVAAVVGPILVSALMTRHQIAHVFALYGLIAALGALVSFWTIETSNKQLEQISP
jgi:putative MFS transporter